MGSGYRGLCALVSDPRPYRKTGLSLKAISKHRAGKGTTNRVVQFCGHVNWEVKEETEQVFTGFRWPREGLQKAE